MSNTVLKVRNLPDKVKKGELLEVFEKFGPIKNIEIKTEPEYHALISYKNYHDVQLALEKNAARPTKIGSKRLILEVETVDVKANKRCFICGGVNHKTKNCTMTKPLETKDVNMYNLMEGTRFFKDIDKNTDNEFQKDLESIRNTSPLVISDKPLTHEQLVFKAYMKIRPKSSGMENKEKLYDERIHLRNIINSLTEDNRLLKTKVSTTEKDNARMQKLIADIEEYIGAGKLPPKRKSNQNQGGDSLFIISLKKKIKDLKTFIQETEVEIETIKKKIKLTNIKDLESEVMGLSQSTLFTNSLLKQENQENMLQSQILREEEEIYEDGEEGDDFEALEHKFILQNGLINQLRAENEAFEAEIQVLTKENKEYEEMKEYIQKNLDRNNSEFKQLQFLLKEKERQFEELKNQMNSLNIQNANLETKSRFPSKEQLKAEALINNELHLKSNLQQKERIVEKNEKEIIDLRNRIQEKSNSDLKEKKQIQEELSKQKEHLIEIEEKYKNLSLLHNIEEKKVPLSPKEKEVPQTSEKILDSVTFSSVQKSQVVAPVQIIKRIDKRPTVKSHDIKIFCDELRYKLMSKKIDQIQAAKTLIPDRPVGKSHYAVREIKDKLMREPFSVREEESAVLLARYMVEDNKESHIEYTEDRTNEAEVIRSVFKNIIGKYKFLTEDEIHKTKEELTDLIVKFRSNIFHHLEGVPNGKTGYVDEKDVRETFKHLGLTITDKQLNYLILSIFPFSNDLSRLAFKEMFKIFKYEQLK